MAYYEHNRRKSLYTAARVWETLPDDKDIDEFMKKASTLKDQGHVRTTATESCIREFRERWKEIAPTVKTGDVVLFSAKLKDGEPIQYQALQTAQEKLSVQSKV